MKIASETSPAGYSFDLYVEPLNCGHSIRLHYSRAEWKAPLRVSIVAEYPADAGQVLLLLRNLARQRAALDSLWANEDPRGELPYGWRRSKEGASLLWEHPRVAVYSWWFDLEAMPRNQWAVFNKCVRATVGTVDSESTVSLCCDMPHEAPGGTWGDLCRWIEPRGRELARAMKEIPAGDSYGNIWKRAGGGYHFHHINSANPETVEAFRLQGGAE